MIPFYNLMFQYSRTQVSISASVCLNSLFGSKSGVSISWHRLGERELFANAVQTPDGPPRLVQEKIGKSLRSAHHHSLALDFKLLKPTHPPHLYPPIERKISPNQSGDHAQRHRLFKMKKFVTSRLPLTSYPSRSPVPDMTIFPTSHTQTGIRGFNSPPIFALSSG